MYFSITMQQLYRCPPTTGNSNATGPMNLTNNLQKEEGGRRCGLNSQNFRMVWFSLG